MTISVIIPVLNEAQALPQTLTHTARLGFEEVIVVDGGSRDGTLEALAPHLTDQMTERSPSSIVLLTSTPGRARQMNCGAAGAQGDILLFLHADTRLPVNARLQILAVFQDPSYVGGRFDVRFEQDRGWAWVIARMMNVRSRWSGIATGDQAIFVRRSVFEQLGGFTDIPLMEDLDFSRRLKRAGRVAPLRSKVVTSYRRWEQHGPVRTILLMWMLRFLYWIGVSPQKLSQLYAAVR
jgi:rSAM/selenodomain-associated transferase 2